MISHYLIVCCFSPGAISNNVSSPFDSLSKKARVSFNDCSANRLASLLSFFCVVAVVVLGRIIFGLLGDQGEPPLFLKGLYGIDTPLSLPLPFLFFLRSSSKGSNGGRLGRVALDFCVGNHGNPPLLLLLPPGFMKGFCGSSGKTGKGAMVVFFRKFSTDTASLST